MAASYCTLPRRAKHKRLHDRLLAKPLLKCSSTWSVPLGTCYCVLPCCMNKLHGCSCLRNACLPAEVVSGNKSRQMVGLSSQCLTPHMCMYGDVQQMLAKHATSVIMCLLSLGVVHSNPTSKQPEHVQDTAGLCSAYPGHPYSRCAKAIDCM